MIRAAGVLIITMQAAAVGQSTTPVHGFEVASVKPDPGPYPYMGIRINGQTLTAQDANLRMLIMYAYQLKSYQVAGSTPLLTGPDQRFEVVAKAGGATPPAKDEFREMLQWLLADRFQLTFHHEMRELPVYALVVGKNGSKLKPSAPDAEPMAHFGGGRVTEVTMPKATMDDILGAIDNSMPDRPVIDKTGLTGTYDVKMRYTQAYRANATSDPDPNDISIFTAVQEQLGLKLEAQKATVEVMVVDRAEKPTGN